MSVKYLSCADTAKLVRKALKESFPGVKFSVLSKTYSGGASISVKWTNGPTVAQVNAVAKAFQGSYFDGMTDYKGNNYNTLNGEPVSFAADFVFTDRQYTVDFLKEMAQQVATKYLMPLPEVVDSPFGAWVKPDYEQRVGNFLLSEEVMMAAAAFSFDDAAESPTLDSVKFLGDDGYGYGAVGMVAN